MQWNMSWGTDDTMSQIKRITHIDSLRGVAVLLMVMVHAAATWNPFQVTQSSILAYIVSGLGGLAAPLFVTLFGWGIVRSKLTIKARLFQTTFLLTAQVLVNLTSPHLFHPFTPGILSLMGLLTLILPALVVRMKPFNIQPLAITALLVFGIQLFVPEIQGVGEWSDRVSDDSAYLIGSNLFLTGTYPLFPWIVFALLGATISLAKPESSQTLVHNRFTTSALVFGLVFCLSTFVYSNVENALWAHPTEDAYLTFFPANSAFIIAAMTGVLLVWALIQRYELPFLNSTGQISLTVYLVHFIPLSLMNDFEIIHQWELTTSATAVLLYTLAWIPVSALWLKHWPHVNFETILKRIRKSL